MTEPAIDADVAWTLRKLADELPPPGRRAVLWMLSTDTPHSHARGTKFTGIPASGMGATRARALRQLGDKTDVGSETESDRTGSNFLDDLLDEAEHALREKLEPKVIDLRISAKQGAGDAQLDGLLHKADATLRATLGTDTESPTSVRAREIAAFDDAVKRYSPVILGFFRKELGPDQFEQAEDLTSETVVASWATLRGERSTLPEDLQAWLLGTARHILSRHFKDKFARSEVLGFEPGNYDPEDSKSLEGFREIEYEQGLPRFLKLVDEAIESMPVKYRDVIRINMRDGRTGRALAAQIGVTPAEASRLLNEARPKLANMVGTLLMARTCREACPKLNSYLEIAGWTGGPFSETLRQRLMQHISSCSTCTRARNRENWISILP